MQKSAVDTAPQRKSSNAIAMKNNSRLAGMLNDLQGMKSRFVGSRTDFDGNATNGPSMGEPTKIRLVRVQDETHGMFVDGNGNLQLHRERADSFRNTMHFAVNAVVANHVYGAFDGRIVVIADPREMPVPSGLGQVDTWFHADEQNNLNAGKAVVIAPEGTALPPEVTAIFYHDIDQTSRDEAVHNYLLSIGVAPQSCGMWGWSGTDLSSHDEWRRSTANGLYGERSQQIHLGPHDGSIDERIESAMGALKASIELARENYLFSDTTGIEKEYTIVLHDQISDARRLLGALAGRERAQAYVKKCTDFLDWADREREGIEQRFARPYTLHFADGTNISGLNYDAVQSMANRNEIPPDTIVSDLRSSDFLGTVESTFDVDIGSPHSDGLNQQETPR